MVGYALHRIKRRLRSAVLDFAHRRGLVDFGLDYRFLFACSTGVYLYDRGVVTKVMEGDVFGITRTDDPSRFFVADYLRDGTRDERSRIFLAEFDGIRMQRTREIRFRQSGREEDPVRVHQMHWFDGHLWVTNTRQNVVWKASPDGEILSEWTGTRRFEYDLNIDGDAARAKEIVGRVRASFEYEHYNSIGFRDGAIYILAHNSGGVDKSRQSFLVVLNSNLEEIERRENVGKACHETFFHGDDLYVCSSADGRLLKNFKPVLATGQFIRGLDAVGSILILGSSSMEVDRAKRGDTPSCILFVDAFSHQVVHTLKLGRVGEIHEILAIDDPRPKAERCHGNFYSIAHAQSDARMLQTMSAG